MKVEAFSKIATLAGLTFSFGSAQVDAQAQVVQSQPLQSKEYDTRYQELALIACGLIGVVFGSRALRTRSVNPDALKRKIESINYIDLEVDEIFKKLSMIHSKYLIRNGYHGNPSWDPPKLQIEIVADNDFTGESAGNLMVTRESTINPELIAIMERLWRKAIPILKLIEQIGILPNWENNREVRMIETDKGFIVFGYDNVCHRNGHALPYIILYHSEIESHLNGRKLYPKTYGSFSSNEEKSLLSCLRQFDSEIENMNPAPSPRGAHFFYACGKPEIYYYKKHGGKISC